MQKVSMLFLAGFVFTTSGFSVSAQNLSDAVKAIKYEQYEKAKLLLSKLSTTEAAYYLGDVYFKQGVLDSAAQGFQKAMSMGANSGFGYIGSGRVKASNGDAAGAKSDFTKALSLAGTNYSVLLELGKAYVEQASKVGDPNGSSALQVLNRASQLQNRDYQVYLAIGDADIEKGDGAGAAKNYNQAISMNAQSAEPYTHYAALFRHARNAVVSLDYVSQGIAKDPTYGPIYREQAETYRAASRFTEAVSSYEKYISLTDRSIDSRIRYIQFLYLNQDYAKANTELNNLKTTLKGDFTKNPALYRLDAISNYETGIQSKDQAKLKSGLESMQKLFEQKSVKPLPIDYSYLGKLYSANGNDSLAIKTLEQAVAQDSANASDYYGALIDAYRTKRKYKEAAAIYQKRIERGDTSINNYVPYAFYTYFSAASSHDTSNIDRADLYLKKVNDRNPTYVDAYMYRGRIAGLRDPNTKKGLALPYYQKVIDMSSTDQKFQAQVQSDPKYKKYLIEAYEYVLAYDFKKKDFAAEKDMAAKLTALDPGNAQAELALKQKNN